MRFPWKGRRRGDRQDRGAVATPLSVDDRPTSEELDDTVAEVDEMLDGGGVSPKRMRRIASVLARSAKQVGARGVLGGRWGAEVLMGLAGRIRIRDRAALRTQYPGVEGKDLAEALVKGASRSTAAVGAAAGALATVQEFAPPTWLALPLELAAETVVVAAIEVKLVAELHEVFGAPVQGQGTSRAKALLTSWAERRGVTPKALVERRGHLPPLDGIASSQGAADLARDEVLRVVRKRLIRAMTGNVASLGPLLTGAVAGAEINRRTTRALGQALTNDLARQHGWPGTLTIDPAPR